MIIQINVITSVNCKDRIDIVNQTWGKNVDNLWFYSDHNDIENKVYQCSDNQKDCGLKTANRLKQILHEGVKYDWYFFVDDDTYVNAKALKTFIESHPTDRMYGLPVGTEEYPYIQGGAGILIPGNLLKKININDIEDQWLSYACGFGDLWWSFIYKKYSFKIEAHPGVFCGIYCPNEEIEINNRGLADIITLHPLRGYDRMNHYHILFEQLR